MIVIFPIFLQSISTSMYVTELRFYYRYHTNQLLNAVIAVVAPLVIYQSATLQDCII
jgi:hypothetical protein